VVTQVLLIPAQPTCGASTCFRKIKESVICDNKGLGGNSVHTLGAVKCFRSKVVGRLLNFDANTIDGSNASVKRISLDIVDPTEQMTNQVSLYAA
jgi:hypothetical protein